MRVVSGGQSNRCLILATGVHINSSRCMYQFKQVYISIQAGVYINSSRCIYQFKQVYTMRVQHHSQ
jgi:hypothetical protein